MRSVRQTLILTCTVQVYGERLGCVMLSRIELYLYTRLLSSVTVPL
jgi:hypothetical protein